MSEKTAKVGAATPLVLAIGRGRAFAGAHGLLSELGFAMPDSDAGRAAGYDIGQGVHLQVLRNWDVPVYVSEGAADLGIVGNDILAEDPSWDLYRPVDLGISRCRLVLAAPVGRPLPERPRIATRHTRSTGQWFLKQGRSLHLIPLLGSLESAPERGLADGICDLVETGRSLRENRLEEVVTLMSVSARLVVNKASARSRMHEVDSLVRRFAAAAESRTDKSAPITAEIQN